jgi:hypothetical protein
MSSEGFLCFDDESIDQGRIVTDKYPVLNELFCPICYSLLWKPRSCASCQNLFCNHCIQTWLHTNPSTCPLCRSPYEEKPAPPFIQSILAHFSIHCRNTSLGCREILPYDLLEQHESVKCNFLTKKCRLCEQIVLLTDNDQHKNVCKLIVVRCPSCQCDIKTELFERHQNECLQQDSNADVQLDEEFFILLELLDETMLSTTAEVELVGVGMFYQTREKNCPVRFWAMCQLKLINLPKIHLILCNVLGWGCAQLIYALS